MLSIDDHILSRIKEEKSGYIFFAEDFDELGSNNAVRVALHRLVKKGVIVRVARGMFVFPKTSKLLNKEVGPGLAKIASAIARRDRARIVPSGNFALNALGLSDQVPMNVVYYTDGKARKLKVGNNTITFKKASPRRLSYKGAISQLVVFALGEIGKDKVTAVEEEKIIKLLQKEDIDHLKHDIQLAPQWVGEIMSKAYRK